LKAIKGALLSLAQLGVPQGKVMDLVEMVTEIKEVFSLLALLSKYKSTNTDT